MNFSKHSAIASGRKRATNVSIDSGIIDAAKALGINISQTADAALAHAVEKARNRRWQEENRATIDAWNEWIDENGLPLAEYRPF